MATGKKIHIDHLVDKEGNTGNVGQVLSKISDGVKWIDSSSGGGGGGTTVTANPGTSSGGALSTITIDSTDYSIDGLPLSGGTLTGDLELEESVTLVNEGVAFTIGSELISNGTFDTGTSNGVAPAGWVIDTNDTNSRTLAFSGWLQLANWFGTSNYVNLSVENILTSGKTYLVELDYWVTANPNDFKIIVGDNDGTNETIVSATATTQSFSQEIVANGTDFILRKEGEWGVTIDNVSVKEVLYAPLSKLVFDNEGLTPTAGPKMELGVDGQELLLDISYSGGAKTNALSIKGGGSNSNEFKIFGNDVLTTSNTGSGNGLDSDLLDGQEGTYYLDYTNFTNTPSDALLLTGGTLTGDLELEESITLVSEGATTVIGSELISNGDFTNDANHSIPAGWTVIDSTNNSRVDYEKKFRLTPFWVDSPTSMSLELTTDVLTSGKTYIVEFDYESYLSDGDPTVQVILGTNSYSTPSAIYGTSQTYSQTLTANGGTFALAIDDSQHGVILDNISVKESSSTPFGKLVFDSTGTTPVAGPKAELGIVGQELLLDVTSGGTTTNVLRVKSDEFKVFGNEIFHEGNNAISGKWFADTAISVDSTSAVDIKFPTVSFKDAGIDQDTQDVYFEVLSDGRWRVNVNLTIEGTTSSYRWTGELSINVNGTSVQTVSGGYIRAASVSYYTQISLDTMLELTANDEVSISVKRLSNLTGNATIVPAQTFLEITKMN